MASQEPIERLYIKIESDVSDLLKDTEKAVDTVENSLERLDRKGKKTDPFKNLRSRLDELKQRSEVALGSAEENIRSLDQEEKKFDRVIRFEKFREGLRGLVKTAKEVQAAIAVFVAAIIVTFKMANKAVENLRVERAFFGLAAGAEQSGDAILAAMQNASQGVIGDLTLMKQANEALKLGIAKTPEEFEKLTRSAIKLGAATGRGPVDAINDLVNAAGKGSVDELRSFGISLSEINELMDQFAQTEFGTTVDQLDQIKRDMLFTKSAIAAANRKAEELGDSLGDVGEDVLDLSAQTENFKTELNKTSLILVTLLNQIGAGPGILNRLTEGAIEWQLILIEIAALVMTIADWLKQAADNIISLGVVAKTLVEMPLPELMQYIESGEFSSDMHDLAGDMRFNLGESLTENLEGLKEKFQDILDPEIDPFVIPPPELPPDTSNKIKDLLRDLTTDMLDAQQDRHDAIEELEKDHAARMADINQALAEKIADINADLQRDLADLARDTAQRRADIMRDAQRDLAELASDTDERLADERRDFNTEERRDTEDHLRDMRRLTEQYLFDLEDAVAARDARAVVDLQRRFAMESQQREEDFTVNQGREREDFSLRLQEIRENEARRREEILRSQAEALSDLMRNEAERRAEIERSHTEQIAKAEANATRLRAREQQNYAERQADLDAALSDRLTAVAKELADEEKINTDGARRILGALSRYFGQGGEIDKLMEDFQRRRAQRLTVELRFEGESSAAARAQAAQQRIRDLIPSFQHGGTLVARKPTLALFGEAGPEVAQFTPLGQAGGGVPQKLQIEFTGSAPPGIRSAERDQIAAVLLDAIRDTGQLR